MHRRAGLRAFLLLIVFSSLWPLFAAGPEALSVHAVTVDFPLISIRVKLIASGSFDVSASTFAINEGGAAIADFAVASATPRQIMAFVLDRSSSLENQIKDVRRSAVAFLKSLPVGLKIEVLSFASDVEIDQEFTLARNDLISAVEFSRVNL
ncbi:MAG TPA: hypothetical protein PKO06_02555, partial [Candidatus Ozemobacteraceae bacterium]|nr:hypothetical protein [Candidatus Ozemobacteraceae bacterium]